MTTAIITARYCRGNQQTACAVLKTLFQRLAEVFKAENPNHSYSIDTILWQSAITYVSLIHVCIKAKSGVVGMCDVVLETVYSACVSIKGFSLNILSFGQFLETHMSSRWGNHLS